MRGFCFAMVLAALVSVSLSSTPGLTASIKMAGEEAIMLSGDIVEGDADRLGQALDRSRNRGHGTLVVLDSGGGNLWEGLKAADMIADAHANVVVGENMLCASACFLLFVSGENKGVAFGARVGVHSPRQTNEGKETAETAAISVAIAREYERRGLPPTVIAKSVTTPPDKIYWLSESDMREMHVIILSAFSDQTPPESSPRSEGRTASVPRSTTPRVSSRFFIEGAYVGGNAVPNAVPYREYSCRPSTQYPSSIWCTSTRFEDDVRVSRTVLHSHNGVVFYINKEIVPAYFGQSDIEHEIKRLSERYGVKPNISRSVHREGYPDGIIATWGDIELRPLGVPESRKLAIGKSPNAGVLVDFLNDFHASARASFPVYSLGGGSGFVWIASVDQGGTGKLRFLAANPRMMRTPLSGEQTD